MNDDEALALRTEIQRLSLLVADLQTQLQAAQQLVSELQQRLAQQDQDPPAFVKPNKPPRPADRPPRRKRDPSHNNARQCQTPTQQRQIALANCPDCGCGLYGSSIARTRQLIDLPQPQPVAVIEYQLLKRYCPHCEKWREPHFDSTGVTLGRSRFSNRIIALLGWLRTTLRLPLRQIKLYLWQMHQLELSVGAISTLLERLSNAGEQAVSTIRNKLRHSSVLYMDETGWREDGQNGYVWVMSNGLGERYFEYDHSRAGAVARRMSGTHYSGTLCSDFYAAYNEHSCRHQRCWAHLLRDLRALQEQAGSSNAAIVEWVNEVVELYKLGQELDGRAPPPSPQEREVLARQLRAGAHELGLKWAAAKGHAAQAMCKRLLRHEGELFEFVRQAAVAATNNEAERAIRPLAVVRKISGGSRSAEGSKARMRLQTLFGTWAAQSKDPLAECMQMLAAKTPLPAI